MGGTESYQEKTNKEIGKNSPFNIDSKYSNYFDFTNVLNISGKGGEISQSEEEPKKSIDREHEDEGKIKERIKKVVKSSGTEIKKVSQFIEIGQGIEEMDSYFKRGFDKYGKEFTKILKNFLEEITKEIKKENKKEQLRQKAIAELPDFLGKIEGGKISIQLEGTDEHVTFSREHLKYAIENKKNNIDLGAEHIQNYRKAYPNSFKNLIKNKIPKETQAIDYRNDFPKNLKDRENALETGASELSTICENNKKLLCSITGWTEDELQKTRKIRDFFLTNPEKLETLRRNLNYNDEIKKVNKDKGIETDNTSNYTMKIIKRFGIDTEKFKDDKDNDGGTGILAIIKYYEEHENDPNAQDFCEEYKNNILPKIEKKFQEITETDDFFKDELNRNDFGKNIEKFVQNGFVKRSDYKRIMTIIGNNLNEENQTEELKKQSRTRESIETGDKLHGVIGEILDYTETPEKRETMEETLRGVYFQKHLQNKLDQLKTHPKLQGALEKNPELLKLLNVEDLANLDPSNLQDAQRKLLNLIGKIFFSETALKNYKNTNLDDERAVSKTIDDTYKQAMNDEALFKDFEETTFNLEEEEEKYEGTIDIMNRNNNIGQILDKIDSIQKTLSEAIQEYLAEKENPELEGIFDAKAKKEIYEKLQKHSKKIGLEEFGIGLQNFIRFDAMTFKEGSEDEVIFQREGFETKVQEKMKRKIPMERIKALEKATEMTVKKMIKEEREQKPKYVERVDEKLHKIIIKNRITNTINELSQYRYTNGLEINTKDTKSITIDKETLDITMTGTYEGEPCKLCIDAEGMVKITTYYNHNPDQEAITFDNAPNFPLFKIPSIKEQEETCYKNVGYNENRKNVDNKLDQQVQEKNQIEKVEHFPRQKEIGLLFQKIKAFAFLNDNTINKSKNRYEYQFFNTLEKSIKDAETANRIRSFITKIDQIKDKMNTGESSIQNNSLIFRELFNKEKMDKLKTTNTPKFEENPYILVLEHFMRKEDETFRLQDAENFVNAFYQGKGDQEIKNTEQKILGLSPGETDPNYAKYKDTRLTKLITQKK